MGPPFLGTEEGFKPTLCAVASGVVPQGIAFCSTMRAGYFILLMATHSSILAWRIPWTEEPGGLRRVLEGTGGGRVRDDVCSSPE